MPIYEYRCPNGHTFEVFQRMADPPVESCQRCGAAPVEKLLFPVAVHFKGSGFYSTDYGRRSGASKDGEGGASASKDAPLPSGDKGGKGDSGKGDSGKGDKGAGGDRKAASD